MKVEYANSLCLGGTMVWALDLDTPGSDTSIDSLMLLGDSNRTVDMARAVTKANNIDIGLFWTPCLPKEGASACPTGYNVVAWGHGKVFDADLQHLIADGCHGGGINGFQRALCAPNNVQFDSLQWGPGSVSKACNSKCPKGWITVTQNSHISGQKSGCKSGSYAPLCALDMTASYNNPICYSDTTAQILSGSLALRKDAAKVSDFDIEDSQDGPVADSVQALRRVKARKQAQQKDGLVNGCGPQHAPTAGDIQLNLPLTADEHRHGSSTWYSLKPTTAPLASTPKPESMRTEVVPAHFRVPVYSTDGRTCVGKTYPQACFYYSSVANLFFQAYRFATRTMQTVFKQSRRWFDRARRQQ